MRTTSDRYTLPAIALHWLLALALIGTFCLGLYAHELQFSMTKLKLMNWHKWAGITILFCRCCGWCGASRTGLRPTCRCPPGKPRWRICCTG